MKVVRYLLTLSLLAGTAAFAKEAAPKKSSEIPARREFPLNPAVNPCENFYDYVCSKVTESFQLREDRSAHTFSFNDSAERLLEKKKQFFAGLAKRETKSPREEGLKNYYLACMNPAFGARDEKAEVARVRKALNAMKTREELLAWIEDSYLSVESSPLEWGPISNMDKPLRNDLYIVTDVMTLPEKSYYKNDAVMGDFKKLATAFYKTIGEKDPAGKAATLLKMESALAEVYPSPEEFRQIVNNRSFIPREKLKADYPSLRLDAFLNEVPSDVVIRDWTAPALKNMNAFLATGDLQDIKTVLLFHALSSHMDDGYPAYFKERFEFERKHFGGPNKRPARDERCTRKEMRIFAKEIDSILLPELFPNFPREKFVALAEKVRDSLTRSLEKNSWLSRDARKEAIQKMKKAKLFLVAPETEKQWDFLPQAEYFKDQPLKNTMTVTAIIKKKSMRELREENDPGRWDMGPLTVNAYYDPSYNKFVMPVGILQYPFYDPNLPDDQNLASVGSVIGHELGHGVDDQGARYDSDGKQRQWMSMKDLAELSNRTKLLVSQFEAIGHNGNLTLGENIGDLVGVTATFHAASQDPEFKKSIPRQKAYFEAYARLWCEVKRPKYAENQLKTDPHSLGTARVNEQIKQQPAFKQAYQCKDTDPMVLPKEKLVHIW